jgi:hypothetical protein
MGSKRDSRGRKNFFMSMIITNVLKIIATRLAPNEINQVHMDFLRLNSTVYAKN